MQDFWLIERGDLLEAGFSQEHVQMFEAKLKQLDHMATATEPSSSNESLENRATTRDVQATSPHRTVKTSVNKENRRAELPQRVVENLQSYFPALDRHEIERTLENLDGSFDKALMLLTGL